MLTAIPEFETDLLALLKINKQFKIVIIEKNANTVIIVADCMHSLIRIFFRSFDVPTLVSNPTLFCAIQFTVCFSRKFNRCFCMKR